MGFLRGLAATILTFLLFLSLAAFGTVYALNNTLLNPDFVVAQVDRLDVASLAGDIMAPQVSGQLPPEMNFWKKPSMTPLPTTNRG